MTTRRDFLEYGIGSFVLFACGSPGRAAPCDALPPTHHIADDDPPPADAFTKTACRATAANIEGPFYRPGAPHRAVLADDRTAGERLLLGGTVLTTGCQPIADAELDIWQADARGAYDNDGYGLRGKLRTDQHGRWQIKTIVPGRYLNGRRYRPAHIHVKVRAQGRGDLTTQLYFAGDPYNDGDDFIVPSLIMPHTKHDGVRRAGFNFVV